MFVVIVHAQVKQEFIQAFITATLDNAKNSLREPGVARFDVFQDSNDSSKFKLIEVYRSEDASGKHRLTAHYNYWRETVEAMMAEPRTRVTYNILFPPVDEW